MRTLSRLVKQATSVSNAISRSSRHRTKDRKCSVLMPVAWRGGMRILKRYNGKQTTRLSANNAEDHLLATATRIDAFVHALAMLSTERREIRVMSLLEDRVVLYQLALSLAKSMLHRGIITAEQYVTAEAIFAEKYGLFSNSIYRDITG